MSKETKNTNTVKVMLTITTPDTVKHEIQAELSLDQMATNRDVIKEVVDGLYEQVKKQIMASKGA